MHRKLPFARPRLEPDAPGGAAEDLARLLHRLGAQGWPLRAFEKRLPRLLELAPGLPPAFRSEWLDGLRGVWRRHAWALRPRHRGELLHLAAAWCDWLLVTSIGERLAERNELDDDGALLLIHACRQLGDGDAAIDMAISRQLANPGDERFAAAHQGLAEWLDWRALWGRIEGSGWGDEEIALEPLAHHHWPDFAWQYHDPAIARLCCLPAFADEAQWHAWLDDSYGLGDQRIDAVMHRDFGFIGCVSLIRHGDVGFFYYWLGPDFQGRGFGPRAVALLLAAAAEAWGLAACYAKVFEDNAPSRRALAKLGFADLGINAVAPDDAEVFYRRGDPLPAARMVDELHGLLSAMQSETRAAALLVR